MEVKLGNNYSQKELSEDGWGFIKHVTATACIIFGKGTIRIIWRVRTGEVLHMWDKKDLPPARDYNLP